MADAKASEDKTRTQALQEVGAPWISGRRCAKRDPFQMFQRNKEQAESVKSKADERGSHFKVVSRRDSALIPDKGHPAGWINRTQERQEAAHRGDDWRSDA